jgi:transketolase
VNALDVAFSSAPADPARAGAADRERSDDRDLAALALRVREHCLRLTAGGGCFIGASLACADLLVHLYARVLNTRKEALDDPGRDYLLLSRGHDVPALYATLAELGFFPPESLSQHLKTTDPLYWHPNRSVPGVEFHSGSLGHLLAVGIGIALDIRLRGETNRVFVVLGDGDLDEGSVWDSCLVAAAHRLDNLVAVVDRSGLQANGRTEELVPLEPPPAKFEAFGWLCRTVDGHSFADLDEAFAGVPAQPGRPTAIVARTVRGRGVPSLEDRADRWFTSFTDLEREALVRELHGGGPGALVSERKVVR